jgi:hypothetical protein
LSNDLEVIVRPSQTLDYAPAKVYYQPGQIGVPNTVLRIGRRGGSVKSLNGSLSASATYYMANYASEKEDKTTSQSPDDD